MKKFFKFLIGIIIVGGISYFIGNTFIKSSPPPKVALVPVIAKIPSRVYGVIEPEGREVFVSPPATRRVAKIYVKEGEKVKKGQRLCSLDNEVEIAEYNLAFSRIESSKKNLEISREDMKRKDALFESKIYAEYESKKARLKKDYDESSIDVAVKELDLAKARIDELELKAPADGILYKFDVRQGETLAAGDNSKIIIGSPELWVRLFVEAYWLDRVQEGSKYKIYTSETNDYIGTGEVLYKAPYMGQRNFRTEDSQERLDTKLQEVVLSLKKEKDIIPIGLSVVAELSEK